MTSQLTVSECAIKLEYSAINFSAFLLLIMRSFTTAVHLKTDKLYVFNEYISLM